MTPFHIEIPPKPLTTLARLAKDLNANQAIVALVAILFAITGPVAIMLAVGTQSAMPEDHIASWIFGAFFINGLISLIMCLIYRQPLMFLWSIPGIVVVGPALEHPSFNEVLGAYYVSEAIMVALGLSGWVRRFIEVMPMPIIMGMVAGVFLQFGLGWAKALNTDPWIAVPMTLAFFVSSGPYPALLDTAHHWSSSLSQGRSASRLALMRQTLVN